MDIEFNNNKHFFSEFYKFTMMTRLEKRATIIKVDPKHIIRNNTAETIHI